MKKPRYSKDFEEWYKTSKCFFNSFSSEKEKMQLAYYAGIFDATIYFNKRNKNETFKS